MSIRFKLLLSLGLLAAALIALGVSGFVALQQTSAQTKVIVADGVDGLGQITRINDMYSNIVRDTQGVVLGVWFTLSTLPLMDAKARSLPPPYSRLVTPHARRGGA